MYAVCHVTVISNKHSENVTRFSQVYLGRSQGLVMIQMNVTDNSHNCAASVLRGPLLN